MSVEPFMWATFCDDVRQEVGNKLSYIGVYGPNLIVPALPTTLLKLCCVLSVRLPGTTLPTNLAFRLYRDEEIILETEISPAAIKEAAGASPEDGAESLTLTISTVAQLVNFLVTQRCLLKARAVVDGKELRGGALELMATEMVR